MHRDVALHNDIQGVAAFVLAYDDVIRQEGDLLGLGRQMLQPVFRQLAEHRYALDEVAGFQFGRGRAQRRQPVQCFFDAPLEQHECFSAEIAAMMLFLDFVQCILERGSRI